MFCKNCGAQCNDGAKFCAKCGTPIEAAPVQQPVAPVQPETPVQQPYAPVQPETPVQQPYAPVAPQPTNDGKKKGKIAIIIGAVVAAIAVIAIIIAVVAGVANNNNSGNDNDDDDNNKSSQVENVDDDEDDDEDKEDEDKEDKEDEDEDPGVGNDDVYDVVEDLMDAYANVDSSIVEKYFIDNYEEFDNCEYAEDYSEGWDEHWYEYEEYVADYEEPITATLNENIDEILIFSNYSEGDTIFDMPYEDFVYDKEYYEEEFGFEFDDFALAVVDIADSEDDLLGSVIVILVKVDGTWYIAEIDA